MRRFDKKKLMKKANILAEKRYLASKGLIKEDVSNNRLELVDKRGNDRAIVIKNFVPPRFGDSFGVDTGSYFIAFDELHGDEVRIPVNIYFEGNMSVDSYLKNLAKKYGDAFNYAEQFKGKVIPLPIESFEIFLDGGRTLVKPKDINQVLNIFSNVGMDTSKV